MEKRNQYNTQGRRHGVWKWDFWNLSGKTFYHQGNERGIEKWWNNEDDMVLKRYHITIK